MRFLKGAEEARLIFLEDLTIRVKNTQSLTKYKL